MIVGAIVLSILLGTRNKFALLFNDDKKVVKLTAEVLPWVALFQIAGKLIANAFHHLPMY
jgi:MATE family multidrug resistance protein